MNSITDLCNELNSCSVDDKPILYDLINNDFDQLVVHYNHADTHVILDHHPSFEMLVDSNTIAEAFAYLSVDNRAEDILRFKIIHEYSNCIIDKLLLSSIINSYLSHFQP